MITRYDALNELTNTFRHLNTKLVQNFRKQNSLKDEKIILEQYKNNIDALILEVNKLLNQNIKEIETTVKRFETRTDSIFREIQEKNHAIDSSDGEKILSLLQIGVPLQSFKTPKEQYLEFIASLSAKMQCNEKKAFILNKMNYNEIIENNTYHLGNVHLFETENSSLLFVSECDDKSNDILFALKSPYFEKHKNEILEICFDNFTYL